MSAKWRLLDAQDQVDRQREELIARIETKLNQEKGVEKLFHLRRRLN